MSHKQTNGNLLSRYIIPILVGLYIVTVAVVFLQQYRLYRHIRTASAISEVQRHSEALAAFRSLYTEKVVTAARAFGMRITHDYQKHPHGVIPLPATLSLELGDVLTRQGRGDTKLYSPYPFPWRQDIGGLRDSFAHDAWEALNKEPSRPFSRIERQGEGHEILRYAVADPMRQSCVECHNTHPDSLRKDWKAGDVGGVLEVTTPIQVGDSFFTSAITESSVIAVALGGLAFFVLTITINHFNRTSVRLNDRLDTLKQYSKELEHCNKDLDEFAHIASHDLRSPLRAIQCLTDWIAEDKQSALSTQSAEHLEELNTRIRHMDRLLTDLMVYFQVEYAQKEVEEVHTQELVQGIVNMLDVPKTFTVAIPEQDMTLVTLKTPLELCLRNLVSNAIRHHHRTDGHLVITAIDEGDFIEFTVIDDGPGIAPEYHEDIFKIFHKLEPNDRIKRSGVGLGLVKKTVEACSGTISVESVVGGETKFRLRWPRTIPLRQHDSKLTLHETVAD